MKKRAIWVFFPRFSCPSSDLCLLMIRLQWGCVGMIPTMEKPIRGFVLSKDGGKAFGKGRVEFCATPDPFLLNNIGINRMMHHISRISIYPA